MKLENLTFEERTKIFIEKISTKFEINKQVIGFENIENELSDDVLNQSFEIPPIIFDEKHLAQIVAFSGTELMGQWIRIVVRTYMEGGKVIYSKLDDDNLNAEILFD